MTERFYEVMHLLKPPTALFTPAILWKVHGEAPAAMRGGRRLKRAHAQTSKPSLASGSVRTRWPVAAKIALQIAGATGGNAGSPTPVGGSRSG